MHRRILLTIILLACAGCSVATTKQDPLTATASDTPLSATFEYLSLEAASTSSSGDLLSGSFPPFMINLALSGASCIFMDLTDFWTPNGYPPQTSDLPNVSIMIDGNRVTLDSATSSASVPVKNTLNSAETKYPGTYALCFKSSLEKGSHTLSIIVKTKLGITKTFGRRFILK